MPPNKTPFLSSELFKHRYLIFGVGATAVIVVGSIIYAVIALERPTVSTPGTQTSTASIIAEGDIEPVANPDLSFEMGGRVARIAVVVGDHVYAGQTLAALDTGTLSASRAAAEAHLDALTAPPRPTDIAIKQASIDQANQAVVATYASVPASLQNAYGKSHDAIHTADIVFSSPDSASPTLLFSTSNSATAQALLAARTSAGSDLVLWQGELAGMSTVPTNADLDSALGIAIQHVSSARTFETALIAALSAAIPTTSFPQSSITSALASASAARDTINGLSLSLTATEQSLVSESLAVQSAQNALDQLNAGASMQDIAAAKAQVQSVDAQIAQNIIAAPFSGTVASVGIKAGQIATPNVPVITLLPNADLQAVVYVTEVDVGHIAVGGSAVVTLDAYGASRPFVATVASVDQAPTMHSGVSAYKVTLAFGTPSSDIKVGMTANAAITPTH